MLPAIKLSQLKNGQWVEFWEVQSESRPGLAYVVAKCCKGTWGCSCPARIFQKGERHNCKHIQHVICQINTPQQPPVYVKSVLTPEKIQKIVSRFSLVEG